MKKAFTYARVSTFLQVDNYSLDAQENETERWCKANNFVIAEKFRDEGKTGTNINERENFKRMLKEIQIRNTKEETRIDAIVAYKLSRISRNISNLVAVLDFLKKHKVRLIITQDGIDTGTALGETFIYLAGVFAQMERENIITQIKSGFRQKASQGGWNGGNIPLGYNYSKDKGFTINEEEAKRVKKIFELYAIENYGYDRICQFLNSNPEKWGTKRGNAWSSSTIRHVLTNPFYIGKIRYGVLKDWGKKDEQGKRKRKYNKEYIIANGNHPAIISEELWERTQTKLKMKSLKNEKKYNLHYMLSGLIKCPECGASMVAHRTKRAESKGGGYYRYYACGRWQNSKTCKTNLVKAEIIEKQAIEKIKEFASNPKIINSILNNIEEDKNIENLNNKLKDLKNRLEEKKQEEQRYYKYLGNPEKYNLKEDIVLKQINLVTEEIQKIELEIRQNENQYEILKNKKLNAHKIAEILKNFNILIEKATEEQKRELMHSLIKEIKINPHKDIYKRNIKDIILHFTIDDVIKYTNTNDSSIEVKSDMLQHILLLLLFHLPLLTLQYTL